MENCGNIVFDEGEPWCCFVGSKHTEAPSPGVAAFIGFAAKTKPVQFENALPFCMNPGDATGTQGIGIRSAEVC